MGLFYSQLKQVLRRLGRAPLFTAVTLITMAVGTGATTAVFTVVEIVLFKPLSYEHPDRLMGVWYKAPGMNIPKLGIAQYLYFIDREQSKTLEDIGMVAAGSYTMTGSAQPEQVQALQVTDGALPILGVRPAYGRLFTRRDDSPNMPRTVVLTYGFWQRHFGGDPSVVGHTLRLDGNGYEIIGVLPEGFRFPDQDQAELIVPGQLDRNQTQLGGFMYRAIARLKAGVTLQEASADLQRLIPIANHSFSPPQGFSLALFEKANFAVDLHPLKKDVIGDVGNVLWVLMGSIAIMLLVACANVANLLLVRVEARRQELALRSALGANRKNIIASLLLESLLLGCAASVIGIALAFGALRLLIAAVPTGLPRLHEIGIDLPVLLFTLGLAFFVSLVIGMIPVLKYSGITASTGLREGGRGLSESRQRHRARAVGLTTSVPMSGSRKFPGNPVYASDHTYKTGELAPLRANKFVSPGYFSTMGIPLIAGRDITWQEEYQKRNVVIISENFAREYWGLPANAIGKLIRVGSTDDWHEIIGVVGNVYDDGVSQDPPSSAYWPLMQDNFITQKEVVERYVSFVVRSPGAGSAAFMNELERAVWSVDGELPLSNPTTVGDLYTKSMARTSFTLVMICVAGAMTLLLSIVGLYGVIAYAVSQRTREIGIRAALGAQRAALTRMFVRQGLVLAGLGAICGVAAAVITTRLMASLLYHVSPLDPWTYAAAAFSILAIASLATYVPSRRAAVVDPVDALRAE